MKQNALTQVVWLFLMTVIILFLLSLLPPVTVGNYTTKQIDLLSDLRTPAENTDLNDSRDNSINNLNDKPCTAIPDSNNVDEQQDSLASLFSDSASLMLATMPIDSIPRKAGDIILIEDYAPQGDGLSHFKETIRQGASLGRPVRIAFLGDSFIEADIFTQNIREALQSLYGGCGVGYMGLHSDFPGFRRSIAQKDNGWRTHSVIAHPEMANTSLPLQLYRPRKGASTRLKGVNKLKHIDKWDISHIVFLAKQQARLSLTTDSAQHAYEIVPSEQAQIITLCETTSMLEIRCDSISGLAIWGAWLDGSHGIAVDNISMRGYSGSSIADIPAQRLQELNDLIPYDLIVLQYGLNRMTSTITNYGSFTKELIQTVNHLRQSMPGTSILIMGIGDRCQNQNGEMQTMNAVYGMRKAQRQAAQMCGCLFWDTCEAMKCLGGMTAFVEKKWANKDYTHISHAGGKPLANEFVKAIEYAIKNEVPITSHTDQYE